MLSRFNPGRPSVEISGTVSVIDALRQTVTMEPQDLEPVWFGKALPYYCVEIRHLSPDLAVYERSTC